MPSLLSRVPDFQAFATYVLAFIVVALLYSNVAKRSPKLDHIPTVGRHTPLGLFSYYTNLLLYPTKFFEIVQRGVDEHRNGVFKVATFSGWTVVVNGTTHIEELRRAPEDVLSFGKEIEQSLQLAFTMGQNISDNAYHISIVRSQLTRNIAAIFPDIREEVSVAFNELLDVKGNEWKTVQVSKLAIGVIARAVNRTFVGLPLCRNADFLDLGINFTFDVVKAAFVLKMLPEFIRPLIVKSLTNVPRSIRRGVKHLRPVIEERRRCIAEFGDDYPDKPRDFLSWLIDEAEGDEESAENLTLRILVLDFAALHTTSISFLHAFYDLLSHPEFIQPLREEIEEIIPKEGWSKVSMSKLVKMDSFLKESQRLNGLGCTVMSRKVMKPFTFSDGTSLPLGTTVCAASRATHTDPEIYGPTANEFDAFRFVGKSTKQMMVTTSAEYVPFGHGQHACPGRFFAVNELKIMFAEVLMNYEFKLEDGVMGRPSNMHVGESCVPNQNAKAMFRRRVANAYHAPSD